MSISHGLFIKTMPTAATSCIGWLLFLQGLWRAANWLALACDSFSNSCREREREKERKASKGRQSWPSKVKKEKERPKTETPDLFSSFLLGKQIRRPHAANKQAFSCFFCCLTFPNYTRQLITFSRLRLFFRFFRN